MKKKILIIFSILFLCICTAFIIASEKEKKIADQLNLFQSVFHLLDENYVDELDPEKLTRLAIDAMLKSTDPYSAFYNEEETIERNKTWKGILYAGIGASVVQRDSNIIIAEPYAAYGAWKNDLRSGDRIFEVEGKSIKDKKLNEVIKLLRGEAETTVNFKIKRNGQILSKSIIRKEIHVRTVPFFGMIDSSIGYIKLDQFLEGTAKDFKEGFMDLKTNHNCKALVIDLRTNNGGLVNEAVDVLNFFLPKQTLICSLNTRNKIGDKKYIAENNPIDSLIPLVLLTSEKSISAAEIFAGCMQDLDRAVILGKKTFGKGFVQGTRFPGYGSSLYLTVARYHTPSGRCIQQLNYSKFSDGKIINYLDSAKESFFTKNKRTVYNKGGVEPDVISKDNEINESIQGLMRSYYIFDFANDYRNSNKKTPDLKSFSLDEKDNKDFFGLLRKNKYDFETSADKQIKDLEKKLGESSENQVFKNDLIKLKTDLMNLKANTLIKSKAKIKLLIEQEIIRRYYTTIGVYEFSLKKDEEIIKASQILANKKNYNSILGFK